MIKRVVLRGKSDGERAYTAREFAWQNWRRESDWGGCGSGFDSVAGLGARSSRDEDAKSSASGINSLVTWYQVIYITCCFRYNVFPVSAVTGGRISAKKKKISDWGRTTDGLKHWRHRWVDTEYNGETKERSCCCCG